MTPSRLLGALGFAVVVLIVACGESDDAGGPTDPNACIDTNNDVKHCGQCGHACVFPNAEPLCNIGVCQLGECKIGFRDCKNGLADGCETYVLGGDPEHCGACSTPCVFPHAKATCETGGTCKMSTCDDGFGDCNNSPKDGCETSVKGEDPKNCGACGTTCGLAQACVKGQCIEYEVTCTTPNITCAQPTCFIPNRFSVTENVVIDRQNGRRLWQRALQDEVLHPVAVTACTNLKVDGINNGWRLPTYTELAALLYKAAPGCPTCGPATDQAVFPNVPINDRLWSSTPGLLPEQFETMSFCDGIPNAEEGKNTDPYPFRCTHDPI
jgi:hypothetical protein